MRISLIAVLTTTACSSGAGRAHGGPWHAGEEEAVSRGRNPNVAAARELDQEGVRSFREGRYTDAARYFGAAYHFGGPSSELWNIARSRERLDDPEGASRAIDEYLAQRDLSPADRAEAEREGRALRARPSVLTVTTSPAGALVTVDGKPAAGPTPLSIEIAPGSHTVSVRYGGYAPETRPLEAHFGRAVIISLDLARTGK
jgi:PEGA domain-containing protein